MRRGEHVPRAFQAPVDVHASADGQVYMFRRRQNESAADSSEEEDVNGIEVMPRVRQEQDRDGNVQVMERELLDGDNLNKLALQYGCKVADIKRVNNLIQEQDLFALKSIKIPVQKHSFLTETHADPGDWQQETTNPSTATPAATPQNGAGASFKPNVQEYTDFLKEVDHDIEKLIQTTDVHDEVFLDSCDMPRRFGFRGHRLTSYGSDWGIQWWNAVIAMLLIGIILPIFYIVYFKTKDNGIVSEECGGIDSSETSSNCSGTHLGTVGTDHIQKPG